MRVYQEIHSREEQSVDLFGSCMDALIQKDQTAQWGALLHGLIHNVNGPLQNMSMLVEMLEMTPPQTNGDHPDKVEVQRKRLRQLAQQIQNLGEMLQDFIALHGIEQNETEVDLRMLLRRLVRVYRANLFFKHNVAVDLQVDENIPLLKIPGRVLVPSFLHLLDNALTALQDAPEKNLRIQCRIEGDAVLVTFTDSGCGLHGEVAPQDLSRPFHSLWPAQNRSSAKCRKHFGLGFPIICRHLTPFGVRLALSFQASETSAIVTIPLPA